MTTYNDEFIKQVKQFDKLLEEEWYERLKKVEDYNLAKEIKWFVNELRIAIKVLYVVVEQEMRETNRITEIISKLPNDEKYQELKKLVEEKDTEIAETLKPLSDYTKELEESKNRRVDYIG